jgi:hypothetical protein
VIATGVVTAWVIIGLAFGFIGALFWFGIRSRIQPPDPDWREHQPTPMKPPRSYWITWWIGTALLILMALAASVVHQVWLVWLAFAAWVVSSTIRHVIAFRHGRRPSRV